MGYWQKIIAALASIIMLLNLSGCNRDPHLRAQKHLVSAQEWLQRDKPEEAAIELERSVTQLGHVGAMIHTYVYNHQLADSCYDDLYACAQQYNVPTDGDHIVGHYRTDADSRARDPATNAQAYMDRLVGDVNSSAQARTTPPADQTATAQFEIGDSRSPQEIAAVLRRNGIEPVWKDWDAALMER